MKLFSKHVDDRLSEYIDRRLTPVEAARVEDHLAQCTECSGRLAGLRQAIAALQSLPEVEPPRSFAINEAMVRPIAAYRPARWQAFAAPAAGMAVIFVLLLGGDLATSIDSEDDEDVVEDAASQELIEMDDLASEQEAGAAQEESAPQEAPDTDREATAGDDGAVPEEETTLADEEPTDRATEDSDEAEAPPPDPETVEQLEDVDEDDDTFRFFVRVIEASLALGAIALGILAFRRWRAAR